MRIEDTYPLRSNAKLSEHCDHERMKSRVENTVDHVICVMQIGTKRYPKVTDLLAFEQKDLTQGR